MQWAVASSFAIPVADAAADCLVDIFSPAAAREFARVVKPGGAFVFAVPGPRHLYGLKEVLYERPYEKYGAGCRLSRLCAGAEDTRTQHAHRDGQHDFGPVCDDALLLENAPLRR